jgi:hypothetical protein
VRWKTKKETHTVKMNVKSIFIVSAVLLLMAGMAQAYDPPRIIGFLQGPEHAEYFGQDYCNVGDLNGDGCDELLFSNCPFLPNVQPSTNRVELYYGGRNGLSDSAVVLVEQHDQIWEVGHDVNFIGNFLQNHGPIIGVHFSEYQPGHGFPSSYKANFYELGQPFNPDPVFTINRPFRPGIFLPRGYTTRPTDLNGDGYNDVVTAKAPDDNQGQYTDLMIYFGGEELDKIPGWQVRLETINSGAEGITVSSGFDINNDGFDDLLVHDWGALEFYMFLGGSPMSTEPLFHFSYNHFQGKTCNAGFALLPDLNGDGYDDWGLYWTDDVVDRDGYYIFYGDGFGDIATGEGGANHGWGEVHIYFGSRWMSGTADIVINGVEDYGAEYHGLGWILGAVGDYNGDGADDIVTKCGTELHTNLVILAGNRDWHVDVPMEPKPLPMEIQLTVSPNPFNATATIRFGLDKSAPTRLAIYRLDGRIVRELVNNNLAAGEHTVRWSSETSGIYFAVLNAGQQRVVKKLVCVR